MSYSLNSLKGIIWGTTTGAIKGDTRSLDCGSHGSCEKRTEHCTSEIVHCVVQATEVAEAGNFVEDEGYSWM